MQTGMVGSAPLTTSTSAISGLQRPATSASGILPISSNSSNGSPDAISRRTESTSPCWTA
jgi:hypothetical protein